VIVSTQQEDAVFTKQPLLTVLVDAFMMELGSAPDRLWVVTRPTIFSVTCQTRVSCPVSRVEGTVGATSTQSCRATVSTLWDLEAARSTTQLPPAMHVSALTTISGCVPQLLLPVGTRTQSSVHPQIPLSSPACKERGIVAATKTTPASVATVREAVPSPNHHHLVLPADVTTRELGHVPGR